MEEREEKSSRYVKNVHNHNLMYIYSHVHM